MSRSRSRRWLTAAWVLCLTSLAACATDRPPVNSTVTLPPVVDYIGEPEVALEAELEEIDDEFVNPTPDGPAVKQAGMLDAMSEMVDEAQRVATERFGAFVFQLDDLVAGDFEGEEPNTSFVRLRLDAEQTVLDGFELDPSLKVRLVLPRSEQRFRLLFSTEDSVVTSDEAERVAGTEDNANTSFALRFVRGARNSTDLDFDIGARQREGLFQIFGRFRARYQDELSERWSARVSNRFYFFARSGFEDRLRFDFTRQVGNLEDSLSRFFRSSTTFDWRASLDGVAIGQTVGLYLDLGSLNALAIEGFAAYDSELNEGVFDEFRGGEVRLRYRRNVYRPWLFFEFWPSVAWPAELDYRATFNGLIRMEITVGGDELLPLHEPRRRGRRR